ncbi:hypothetical protein PT277_09405 [Acetobacteraceae bacterium ESL0709]|nr:hypothetical protein [Acetobacteraceae bacterium ESL0697]MDF7678897.1 hypothetical protein [Acetobacteraceae bacterium ESL0709]
MIYLQITLKISGVNRNRVVSLYQYYDALFLETVTGAHSRELLLRSEDLQVMYGFDTEKNAKAYLRSSLFTQDILGSIRPLLDTSPEIRLYQELYPLLSENEALTDKAA